jgi:hypothetical protein
LVIDLQYPFDEVGKKGTVHVNLMRKLTGTNWRASAETLRIASLVLVFFTAEYCDAVLSNQLQLQWLPEHRPTQA